MNIELSIEFIASLERERKGKNGLWGMEGKEGGGGRMGGREGGREYGFKEGEEGEIRYLKRGRG